MAAYANSLGNGFALDDNWFIVENDVVTEGRYADAFTQSAWPGAMEGSGNYRPVVLSSLAAEWSLWQDAPLGYHVINVAAHVGASLLLLLLLAHFVSDRAAVVGAVLFAIHPVHTEAVANVMGRAELYAACAYLAACLVYLTPPSPSGGGRAGRLLGILALFALALGSKEIAVTLPAMVIALEVYRRDDAPLRPRLVREAPVFVALFALLGCYVIVRWNAIGSLTGEGPAAGLMTLDSASRILSALTVWPHYLRLLVFPLDLSADYSPAVLSTTSTVNAEVVLGGVLLAGAAAGAVLLRGSARVVALAFAWFLIAVSPISNLVVRADILLAERTLYLPSVALALGVAAAVEPVLKARAGVRRALAVAGVVVAVLFFGRTVVRNPAWMDTFTVLSTLTESHPESWMSQRALAVGFERVGDDDAAGRAFDTALDFAPDHYQLLVEAAVFHNRLGRPARAEDLLEQAIRLLPVRPEAYSRMAEMRILRGDGRGAHATALRGVAFAVPDREIWAVVSESYVMKADLEAAARARRASIGVEATPAGWARLAELFDAMARGDEAGRARSEAARLQAARGGGA